MLMVHAVSNNQVRKVTVNDHVMQVVLVTGLFKEEM